MPDRQGKDDQLAPHQPARQSAQLLRLADFDRDQPGRILIEVREYWQSLRRGRAVPARSDIEPRGIHRALDHAFILERIAPGAARFRLAGRHLIDLMGMEVRGMPACAFVNPRSRGRFSDVLESVFRAPQIAELRLHAKAEYARPELQARLLLLPLRSDLGDVTRALGCLIAEGETGVAPRRFDLLEDQVLPIIEGGTTISPSPSAQGPTRNPAASRRAAEKPPQLQQNPEGCSDPAPADTAASPERRRAMFRVVSSND
ncbi:PAS domain-containing protein [Paracoccus marinaquae]|uniref:PAS domain-containing protein n=1 Tax=Paracoccus marinaquae TaxID=2841926 RepID=UPI0032AEB497